MNSPTDTRPEDFSSRPRPKYGLGVDLIGAEEEALVLDVLRRRDLFRYYGSNPAQPPPMVARLEQEFRAFLGVEHALAVTSGTAALEVALAAAGVGPGDEVIVPAWSWISCLTAIVRVGARPVLAEIDDSLNLDPAEIDRLATPRTRAVLVIHFQGVAAEMDRIVAAAQPRGIVVIEDCAQSLGVRYRGRPVGAWGDLATFSFQHNKVATAGEGGMVVTRVSRYYERAVRLHDLGNYRAYHATLVPATEPAFAGGQYRMGELTGAVALAQLRKVEAMRAHCHRLQSRILAQIAGLPGLPVRRIPDPEGDFGYEIYLLATDPAQVPALKERLRARQVNVGPVTGTAPQYAYPQVRSGLAHTPAASPFRADQPWPAPGYRPEDFPRTEALAPRCLALPIGVLYTEADADWIATSVRAVHQELFG
ncbi:MAG: DegT/DnrJ/EryC1/StrS family aminotransferase [Opitutae bacterium]|nr:DegT/DnrJ/EryC1/StrS family aminotransferase [Opitutae bacterium]